MPAVAGRPAGALGLVAHVVRLVVALRRHLRAGAGCVADRPADGVAVAAVVVAVDAAPRVADVVAPAAADVPVVAALAADVRLPAVQPAAVAGFARRVALLVVVQLVAAPPDLPAGVGLVADRPAGGVVAGNAAFVPGVLADGPAHVVAVARFVALAAGVAVPVAQEYCPAAAVLAARVHYFAGLPAGVGRVADHRNGAGHADHYFAAADYFAVG